MLLLYPVLLVGYPLLLAYVAIAKSERRILIVVAYAAFHIFVFFRIYNEILGAFGDAIMPSYELALAFFFFVPFLLVGGARIASIRARRDQRPKDGIVRHWHPFDAVSLVVWVVFVLIVPTFLMQLQRQELLDFMKEPSALEQRQAKREAWERSYPLHSAARSGDPEEVVRLLAAGVDPNARDDRMATPLHWAAQRGGIALDVLLEAGADPRAKDKYGNSPLFWAARSSEEPAFETLIAAGAEVDNTVSLYNVVCDKTGKWAQTAEDVAALEPSVHRLVEFYVDHGLDVRAENNLTALHCAAEAGFLRTARLLVSKGADVNAVTGQGPPASHALGSNLPRAWETSASGALSMVEFLFANGADPNLVDGYGRTTLHYAARMGDVEIISLLVNHGADVMARDKNGKTPLDLAYNREAVAFLERLQRE